MSTPCLTWGEELVTELESPEELSDEPGPNCLEGIGLVSPAVLGGLSFTLRCRGLFVAVEFGSVEMGRASEVKGAGWT